MTIYLTTKDDPKYGPFVDVGLLVDVGLFVGTSIETDSGVLSGGLDPAPYGYSRGGIRVQRGFGSPQKNRSTGRIKVSAAYTRVQPRSSGRIEALSVQPSSLHNPARGGIKPTRGIGPKGGTSAKGYHFISRATGRHEGRSTSQ